MHLLGHSEATVAASLSLLSSSLPLSHSLSNLIHTPHSSSLLSNAESPEKSERSTDPAEPSVYPPDRISPACCCCFLAIPSGLGSVTSESSRYAYMAATVSSVTPVRYLKPQTFED